MMKFKMTFLAAVFCSPIAMAGEAEQAFTGELMDCAAYYQIASEAIAAVDSPQMAAVSSRLKSQATEAQNLAGQYLGAEALAEALEQARQNKIMTMKDASDLRGLMATYKDKCKAIMADPKARLDYWIMATM
ncbi:hypothetical protein L2750_21655 [Shewanella submarina]|uniref:Uncharacterized protein n=1 Tax=Shewanella submarina TaxID=2016376 RepID=A0ABV7GDZ9_9GAMM|nr:hypothetical protein [Shewanella submarina]MCL1039716.1 hypothetical protein [Shewanella submarina]